MSCKTRHLITIIAFKIRNPMSHTSNDSLCSISKRLYHISCCRISNWVTHIIIYQRGRIKIKIIPTKMSLPVSIIKTMSMRQSRSISRAMSPTSIMTYLVSKGSRLSNVVNRSKSTNSCPSTSLSWGTCKGLKNTDIISSCCINLTCKPN